MEQLFDKEKFEDKKELFKYLKENKKELISKKKSILKRADAIMISTPMTKNNIQNKSTQNLNDNEIGVKAIINTTGIFDSHDDVHIKGVWGDTIKNSNILHLQEHDLAFDKIIASGDDLVVSVEDYDMSELGFKEFKGKKTQALVFDSIIKEDRNPYMYSQYKSNYVTEHSVGMQYIELELAINDPSFEEEFKVWEKYIDDVINYDDVEKNSYFWAVTKALVREGSAVPLGSNSFTPTLSTETKSNDIKDISDLTDEEINEIYEEINDILKQK